MTPDLTPGPMVRLLDTVEPTDLERRAGSLLASLPDEMPSEIRKRRVREALIARPQRRAWGPALLRPAAVLTVLTSSVAIAGATVGRGFVSRAYESVREIFEPAEAPKVIASRPKRVIRLARPDVEPMLAPAPQRHADVKPTERRTLRHAVIAPTPAAREQTRDEEEASLVMSAMRALRHERDAERAARLLDRYLAAHPEGALVEEAIALDLEASLARHDDERAQVFAKQYLRRFPDGRFVALARRTLQSTPAPRVQ